MAQVTSEQVAVETSQAPIERPLVVSLPYTDIIHLSCDGLNTFDAPLKTYIATRLEGCGKVDLHSIYIKAVAGAAASFLRIGMSSTQSSASIRTIAGKKNGFKYIATAYNAGTEQERTLVPMANVSRQIQPASTNLPMLRLAYEKSQDMDLVISIFIIVEGVREFNDDIDGAVIGDFEEEEAVAPRASAGNAPAQGGGNVRR